MGQFIISLFIVGFCTAIFFSMSNSSAVQDRQEAINNAKNPDKFINAYMPDVQKQINDIEAIKEQSQREIDSILDTTR